MVTLFIGFIIGIIAGIGISIAWCVWAVKDTAETDDIHEALAVAQLAIDESKKIVKQSNVEPNEIQRNFNEIFEEP